MPSCATRLAACLAIAATSLRAQNFSVAQHEISSGGGRAASARFEVIASLNAIAGASPGTSAAYQERRGYIGQLNEAPAAIADSVQIVPGRAVKILKAALLANDTDADDPFALLQVASVSTLGAPIISSGDWLFLNTPADGDSFAYTITDGLEVTVGVVTLTAAAYDGRTFNIRIVADGADAILRVYGIPGRAYQIQTTESLTPPIQWTNLGAAETAATDGLILRREIAPPQPRFYRAIQP
jgi:hypothetical protein